MKNVILLVTSFVFGSSLLAAPSAEKCFTRISGKTFKCRLKNSDGAPRDPVLLTATVPSSRATAQFDFSVPGASLPTSCSCGYTGNFDNPEFLQSLDYFFCGSIGGGFSGFISPNGRSITLEIASATGTYAIAECTKKRVTSSKMTPDQGEPRSLFD